MIIPSLEDINNEIERRKKIKTLLNFTIATKNDYEVNWHHKIFCDVLDRFFLKQTKRLMIFVPPRHGKSEVVSRRFPAYCFGKDPDARIIACSYGAELSSSMNRDVQRIITSDEYKAVFPKTKLNEKNLRTDASGAWVRNSDMFEIVNHRGTYRSAGVGGAINGTGADYLIIDDAVKNMEEAESETIRSKILDWYDSVAYTRLEKNGSVLIVMTRWHQDDLCGQLLARAAANPLADQWEVVSFPAILDNKTENDPRLEGEALWPNKYPIEELSKIKASVGSRIFSSLYQQAPTNKEGGLIKRGWIKYYDILPGYFDSWTISLDATFKESSTSDFVVFQVWARKGGEYYLVDQIRDRMNFPTTIQTFQNLCIVYPKATAKLVEVKANGQAIVDTLKHDISGIIEIIPKESKEARLSAVAPLFEAGNMYLPTNKQFTYDFVEELCGFPFVKHDDCVDCCSQMLNWARDNGSGYFKMGLIRR